MLLVTRQMFVNKIYFKKKKGMNVKKWKISR